jgi:hypothetical protein
MAPTIVKDLLDELLDQLGSAVTPRREEIRSWALSGVERVRLGDGTHGTVIFKYVRSPFIGEAEVHTHVERQGVPVPRLLASVTRGDVQGMLLEDLGPPAREATQGDAATAAVTVHRTPPPDGLPVLDRAGLTELPCKALAHLTTLEESGRWSDAGPIRARLEAVRSIAAVRAQHAELPPYGLCHSEFHPTSLLVTAAGWRLLDWARAFTGPGLIDLASWQGTTTAPDPHQFHRLLDLYLAAGGPPEAAAPRAGLPPERWASGWHRVWIVEWYLSQATTWIAIHAEDRLYQQVVARHLDEALECLDG